MNADLLLVLGALIACVGLFIVNKPRMDVVALLVIVILPLTGIISMPEALAGFSDTNVVLIAALFGLFISNTATAVLMAPIALSTANHLGASPYPFAMTVALASSAAFMTPISSPVNTLVLGPGSTASAIL